MDSDNETKPTEELKSQVEEFKSQVEMLKKEKDRIKRDFENRLEDAEDDAKEKLAAKDVVIDQMKASKV